MDLRELESTLYYEFRARARELQHLNSSWDVLFAMQHYGVPTRVLDWTESFAVAVFFAVAAAQQFVNQAGAYYGTLFPDLYGLAVHLRRRYC